MAIKYHTGQAPKIAQVITVTYSAISIGETYTITINGKSVSYVATDTLQSTACTALMNLWNTSAQLEHQEHVATGGVTSVILTARESGVPTTVTADATGAPTATVTTTTAASGPNIAFGVASNWDGSTSPSAGDTLVFDRPHEILYGMTSADAYAKIVVNAGSGAIGLPEVNKNGYPEFRTRYLTPASDTGAMIVEIGDGIGSQPARVQIDANTRQVNLDVKNSGNSGASAAVLINNIGASSVVAVHGGIVEITNTSATTITSFTQVPTDRLQPRSYLNEHINPTSVVVSGGECFLYGDASDAEVTGQGIIHVVGDGSINTGRAMLQGIIKWKSTTDVGTSLATYGGGTVDFSEDGTVVEVPAMTMFAGSKINDPVGRVDFSGGIVLSGCKLSDVSIDIGHNRTLGVT